MSSSQTSSVSLSILSSRCCLVVYICSMRASKIAVYNVQCRSVVIAGLVKSTFATLVKQEHKPSYIGDVSTHC